MEQLYEQILSLQNPIQGQFQQAQTFLDQFVEVNKEKWASFYQCLVSDYPNEVKQWILASALPKLANIATEEFGSAFFQLLVQAPALLDNPYMKSKLAQLFALIYLKLGAKQWKLAINTLITTISQSQKDKLVSYDFFLRCCLELIDSLHKYERIGTSTEVDESRLECKLRLFTSWSQYSRDPTLDALRTVLNDDQSTFELRELVWLVLAKLCKESFYLRESDLLSFWQAAYSSIANHPTVLKYLLRLIKSDLVNVQDKVRIVESVLAMQTQDQKKVIDFLYSSVL